MNKLFFLLLPVLAAVGFADSARAWSDGAGCSSRPGQRQQNPTMTIAKTPYSIYFRTPRAEQRWVRDETMTLAMNVALLAKKDVTITSGYRSCDYTRAIRGRNLSQHTQGNAVDFKVAGLSSKEHFEICRRAGGQGCGQYCGNFGHIDLGRYRAWNHCQGRK